MRSCEEPRIRGAQAYLAEAPARVHDSAFASSAAGRILDIRDKTDGIYFD